MKHGFPRTPTVPVALLALGTALIRSSAHAASIMRFSAASYTVAEEAQAAAILVPRRDDVARSVRVA